MIAHVFRKIGAIVRELIDEIARLNRARLPLASDELSRLSRSDRARMVKAALASHHERPSRCC